MIRNKKQMYIVIGVFALVLMLFTTTYAFFNYTRTGTANTIRTGRIYFNTTQSNTLNLTNVFPMSSTDAGNANLDAVSIRIWGDTTYADGEEFEITIVDVNNTVNNKTIPINYIASYSATPVQEGDPNVIGTNSNDYFDDRGSTTAVYQLSAIGEATNGEQVLIGFIPSGASGIDGTLTIKAYLDSSRIAISDTYPEEETDTNNDGYIDGTPTSFGEGKTVLTTTEWNSIQNTQTPLSFKIKAESNEGIWVDDPRPKTATLDVGKVVNKKMQLIALNHTYTGQEWTQGLVDWPIERSDTLADIDINDATYIISSSDSQEKIYAWYNGVHTIFWYTEADIIYLNEDSSYLFYNANANNQLLASLDTSNVKNMSHMFDSLYLMSNSSDYSYIANWDVSKVEDMSYMFNNCLTYAPIGTSLEALNNWDVRNVSNFTGMFRYYQGDRTYNVQGSSLADITFPLFTLRPGSWNNEIVSGNEQRSGTYVPNN